MNAGRTTRDICSVAAAAAVMCVGGLVSIPLPALPISFQLAAAVLCGFLLGPLKGMTAVIIYIALGLFGLPVFSGFSGGFTHVFSPFFGYILGLVPAAAVSGIRLKPAAVSPLYARGGMPVNLHIILPLLSVLPCYAVGVTWQALSITVLAGAGNAASLSAALLSAALFFLKDALLAYGARKISLPVRRAIKA